MRNDLISHQLSAKERPLYLKKNSDKVREFPPTKHIKMFLLCIKKNHILRHQSYSFSSQKKKKKQVNQTGALRNHVSEFSNVGKCNAIIKIMHVNILNMCEGNNMNHKCQ